MSSIFITGTGTDIGKTYVTCQLINFLCERFTIEIRKPIITGWQGWRSDAHKLLSANDQDLNQANLNNCSPWRFKAALSPDMAAKLESQEIKFDEVLKFCRSPSDTNYTLIEGAGGVMTPINSKKTFRDLILELQMPTILVTGSYLGSISHYLTALESLRDLQKVAIILNETPNSEVSLAQTENSISSFTKHPIFTLGRNQKLKKIEQLIETLT